MGSDVEDDDHDDQEESLWSVRYDEDSDSGPTSYRERFGEDVSPGHSRDDQPQSTLEKYDSTGARVLGTVFFVCVAIVLFAYTVTVLPAMTPPETDNIDSYSIPDSPFAKGNVTEVKSADTFVVEGVGVVQAAGVETPPKTGPVNTSAYGLANTTGNRACIRSVAEEAHAHMEDSVLNEEVIIVKPESLPATDDKNRTVAVVVLDGTSIGEDLLYHGYAYSTLDTDTEEGKTYADLQAEAEGRNAGVWGCADGESAS